MVQYLHFRILTAPKNPRSSCDSRTCPPRSWKSRATRWRIRLKSLQSKKALFTSIIIIYHLFMMHHLLKKYNMIMIHDVAWLIHVFCSLALLCPKSDTLICSTFSPPPLRFCRFFRSRLSLNGDVPAELLFEALFWKLSSEAAERRTERWVRSHQLGRSYQ